MFAIGRTRVTLTAVDASGNVATRTFNVTVRGTRDQFDTLRSAIRSLRGPGLHLAADTKRLQRLLGGPRANSQACEPIGRLINTINMARLTTGTGRRAEITRRLGQIRRVIDC